MRPRMALSLVGVIAGDQPVMSTACLMEIIYGMRFERRANGSDYGESLRMQTSGVEIRRSSGLKRLFFGSLRRCRPDEFARLAHPELKGLS